MISIGHEVLNTQDKCHSTYTFHQRLNHSHQRDQRGYQSKQKKNHKVTHVRKFHGPRKSEKFIIPKERKSRLTPFVAWKICDYLNLGSSIIIICWRNRFLDCQSKHLSSQDEEATNHGEETGVQRSWPSGKLKTMAILREIHFVWHLGKMIPR